MAEATTLPTANRKQVGKQLRAVRRRKGLSLSEVARGAGLSRRELVAYERGKIEIPESDLWVLAGSCGVDVSELVPPIETPALAAAPSTIEDTITQLRGGQEGYALNRHLDTLAALRALPPGSSVQLQDTERESMVEALGRDPSTIEKRLVDRMHISREEAARLRELIVPSARRYSPLALEAAEPAPAPAAAPEPAVAAAPAPEPTVAAAAAPPVDDLLAEPPAQFESDAWFADGANFETETPSGPVDVFEELARLPEPAPLPTDAEVRDLLAPPPEPVSATASVTAEHASFSEWQSVRSALPDPSEPVLVESTANPAAAAVTASEAAPIDVAARLDDPWGASWRAPATASAASAPAPPEAPRYDPTSWQPPPPPESSSFPGAEAVVPLEIVEFVDEYVDAPGTPATAGFGAGFGHADTTDTTELGFDHAGATAHTGTGDHSGTDDHTGTDEAPGTPWERQLDPAATSSGFYVDWGTGDSELEPTASPWDPPAPPEVEADAPETPAAWEPSSWDTPAAADPAPAWAPPAWDADATTTGTPTWETTTEPERAAWKPVTEPETPPWETTSPEPETTWETTTEPEPTSWDSPTWAPVSAPEWDTPAEWQPPDPASEPELLVGDDEGTEPQSDEAATYETPTYEAPTYEAPTYEAPTYEAPAFDAPAFENHPDEAPTFETAFPAATWAAPAAAAATTLDLPDEDTFDDTTPDAPEVELAPISWRPLVDPRTGEEDVAASTAAVVASVASALGTIVEPGSELAFEPLAGTSDPLVFAEAPTEAEPEILPEPEPQVVEQFVVAGAEWELGNAVPLVEVRNQGGLVMRRADERWALADLTTSPDFALEVEVDFRSGPGFGVLFRASTDADGHMSGYSFDIDPIHEGGSYLVRQWHADRELWNPLARVAATDPGAMHGHLTLRVVVVDDTLTASVNGEHVLSVESLGRACADRNREPATGNRVGIQAWSSSDLVVDTLRTAER